MQCSRFAPRPLALLGNWLPVTLQCFPHWFPILRRGFHDYFLSLLLEKPRGQTSAQYARSGSDSDHGFNISSEFSTSPPRAAAILPDFHGVSRATWPYRTAP